MSAARIFSTSSPIASSKSRLVKEVELDVIGKFYPDQTLPKEDQSYIEGMFNAICGIGASRNDSLTSARQAIHRQGNFTAANSYEKWLEQSAKMWSAPLTGSLR